MPSLPCELGAMLLEQRQRPIRVGAERSAGSDQTRLPASVSGRSLEARGASMLRRRRRGQRAGSIVGAVVSQAKPTGKRRHAGHGGLGSLANNGGAPVATITPPAAPISAANAARGWPNPATAVVAAVMQRDLSETVGGHASGRFPRASRIPEARRDRRASTGCS
jgi:hypothetical protein